MKKRKKNKKLGKKQGNFPFSYPPKVKGGGRIMKNT